MLLMWSGKDWEYCVRRNSNVTDHHPDELTLVSWTQSWTGTHPPVAGSMSLVPVLAAE